MPVVSMLLSFDYSSIYSEASFLNQCIVTILVHIMELSKVGYQNVGMGVWILQTNKKIKTIKKILLYFILLTVVLCEHKQKGKPISMINLFIIRNYIQQ